MVIGNGMVAKRFKPYQEDDRFLIFASGVSNSKNTDPNEFAREVNLLSQAISEHKDKTLVYFSTCSLYDPAESKSAYAQHKKKIEELIQSQAEHYYIFRVSNIVGHSNNPNTIFNYFIRHIKQGINFDLWLNATRNLIDMDDIYDIIHAILQQNLFANKIVNIANPKSSAVKEIVAAIEQYYNIKATYVPIEKGSSFSIDVSEIQPIIESLQIDFGNTYLHKLLQKYHAN